jgi:hypothetical protein
MSTHTLPHSGLGALLLTAIGMLMLAIGMVTRLVKRDQA